MVLGPFPERKGPRLPGRTPASLIIPVSKIVRPKITETIWEDYIYASFIAD